MTRRLTLGAAMVLLVPMLAIGCQRSDSPALDPFDSDGAAGETMPARPSFDAQDEALVADTRVTGRVETVDLHAGTLSVIAADGEFRFTFSPATEIVGAAGTQGLAASEGGWVTVEYDGTGDERRAVRIEIHG
jgi:hypothetical protein